MAVAYVSPSSTVDQFAEVLRHEGTNWFDIGVFLGASAAEMEVIRQNHATNGVVTCLIKVHDCLVKKGNPLTWEAIATALRRLGNHRLADSIHSKYILPTIRRASSNEDSTTSTTSTVQQHNFSPPTVDQFAEVLRPEGNSWFEIGVFLGASTTEMEVIRQNHATNGVVTCLIKLHECLVKKGKPLTWEAIATTLRSLGNNTLADFIHSKYILKGTLIIQVRVSATEY